MPRNETSFVKSLTQLLKEKHSPLAPFAPVIWRESKKAWPKDPARLAALIVGISGGEQSFGTSGAPDVRINNLWGYGHSPDKASGQAFQNLGEGVSTVARALATNYLAQGLTSPQQLYGRWVKGDPVSTAKQGGYQAGWIDTVGGVLAKLGTGPVAGAISSAPGQPQAPSAPVPGTPGAPATPRFDPSALFALMNSTNQMIGLPQMPAFAAPPTASPGAPSPTGLIATLPTPHGPPVPVVAETKPGKGAAAAIQLAKKYLGTPYVWGGENPGGFDCSGLLQYVWAKQGVTIPRVTYDQWDAGQKIAKNKLQPGDAVFFHMGPKGPEHVGMYLGNDQFIQSPHTGDVVKISKLSTYGGYVGARRYGASSSNPLTKPDAKPKPVAKPQPTSSDGPPSTGGPWKRTADGWVSVSSDPAYRGTIFD